MAILRNFGLKVGAVGTTKFENRIRELVAETSDLNMIARWMISGDVLEWRKGLTTDGRYVSPI